MAENNYSAASAAPGGGGGGEPARGAGGPGPARPKVVLRLGPREPEPEYTANNVPTLSAELAELDTQIAQLTAEIDAATGQFAELEAQIAEKKAAFRVATQRANKIRPIIRRLQVNAADESIIPTIDARLAEIDATIKAMKQARYNEYKNAPKDAWWAQKAHLNAEVHPFELEVERSKLQAQKKRILALKSGVEEPLVYKVGTEYFPETNDRYFLCPELPEIPEETGDDENTMLRYLLKRIQDEMKKGKHGGVKHYMWNNPSYRNSIHERIGICNFYLQLYSIFHENKPVRVLFFKKRRNEDYAKAPAIDGFLIFTLNNTIIKNIQDSKTVKQIIDELSAIKNYEEKSKLGGYDIYNGDILAKPQFGILKDVLNNKGIKLLEKRLYVTAGRENDSFKEIIFSAAPVARRGAGGAVAATSKGGRRKTRKANRN